MQLASSFFSVSHHRGRTPFRATIACVGARRGGELGARGARFWKGLLAVWLGGGVGQSLAFLLARYLVGDWVSTLVRGKSKKWDVVRLLAMRRASRISCRAAGGLFFFFAPTRRTQKSCAVCWQPTQRLCRILSWIRPFNVYGVRQGEAGQGRLARRLLGP